MAKPKELPAPGGAAQAAEANNAQTRTVRALRALELRKSGLPWHVIAPQAGFKSPKDASNAVSALLSSVKRESSQEFIELQMQRLDQIISTTYLKFLNDQDPKRGALLLKTMVHQNVLMGLNSEPIIAARNARGRSTGTGAMLPGEAYAEYASADDMGVVEQVLEAEYRDLVADEDLGMLDEMEDEAE